jgi:hypothetical protein
MKALQTFVRQLGMAWCHPDDFTILARNDIAGLDVLFQVWSPSDANTTLAVQAYRGGGDSFEAICAAAEGIAGAI